MGTWYKDRDSVIQFADALQEASEFETTDEMQEFYRTPHKWNAEFSMWDSLDRPMDHTEENWDEFIDFLGDRE